MRTSYYGFGMHTSPMRNAAPASIQDVKRCLKKVLWENVSALMRRRYGTENLNQLARDAGFGPATSQRIKDGQTSVGLEVVQQAAEAFGLQGWQLLYPDLDPEHPPKAMDDDLTRRMWLAWSRLPERKRRTVVASAEEYLPDEDSPGNNRASGNS
jgi:hypothetical protein